LQKRKRETAIGLVVAAVVEASIEGIVATLTIYKVIAFITKYLIVPT
jgi:hypothetical protein